MVPFCPVPFCPTVPFFPDIPCSISPAWLRLEKTHYVNYDIPCCSIKGCETANNGYVIIFNHMQRFYHLIWQSNWCQNVSKLIIKRTKFRFSEILNTWSIASSISMYDAELDDDRNQMDVKINPPNIFFFKAPGVPFCPHVPFCPDLQNMTSYTLYTNEKQWFIRRTTIFPTFYSMVKVGYVQVLRQKLWKKKP